MSEDTIVEIGEISVDKGRYDQKVSRRDEKEATDRKERKADPLMVPLLAQNNPRVVQPSWEAKLQNILNNGFLSSTYRIATPRLNRYADAVREISIEFTVPPAPNSVASQNPKLYASLGIVSIFCRISALTLPFFSAFTELLQAAEESKVIQDKAYTENLHKWDSNPPSPMVFAIKDLAIAVSTFGQGFIQLSAFPITFLGAQKLAAARTDLAPKIRTLN